SERNVTFRWTRLTSHFESVKSDVEPQLMCSLQITVVTTMFQRPKLLIDLLALYLNRQKGMALLKRVQASSLSDDDRDRVSHILRVMLRLPDDQV
ncbi:MAG: hypothetical protein OEU26_30775, partial [Candidatus Tectomicrobia bacterium]|nr:hypothetical protein [Candidatus Tectomicrobia bacterium]